MKKQKLRNEGTTVKKEKREPGEMPKAKIKGRLGFRRNVAILGDVKDWLQKLHSRERQNCHRDRLTEKTALSRCE